MNYQYRTGDGRMFCSLTAAARHADRVHLLTGVFIAVEAV